MTFDYRRSGDAPSLGPDTAALAGGTELLSLHKVGLVEPAAVLDLKTSGLPATIERTEDGWRLGALTTLADVEDHAPLADALPLLRSAVSEAATRQLRNRATVGGNLLQRPRCRYYREEATTCWFAGGDDCPARHGRNERHAIFGSGPCVAVQPSDLASALVAVDAVVHTNGPGGRSMPVAELLAVPTDEVRSLHRLGDDEIIESITIADGGERLSTYVKAMDRAAWSFALAGVAAVLDVDGNEVRGARVVASGVAAVPWRLEAVEAALVGGPLSTDAIAGAAGQATDGASPLSENAYKCILLRGLVRRALEQLADENR
jgi:xanthine dehydrogenase YagS FAD-binding subunit